MCFCLCPFRSLDRNWPRLLSSATEILSRYQGLGCRRAAANIGGALHDALAGRVFTDQSELDRAMIALDGTPTKSRIGANAILAVSVAFARACAAHRGVPLYQHFADMLGSPVTIMPRLTINLLQRRKACGQSGFHSGRFDSFPFPHRTIDEALVSTFDIYQSAAELVFKNMACVSSLQTKAAWLRHARSAEEMLDLAVEAIERAGYVPGRDVFLRLDVAATHFYQDRQYQLDSELLDSPAMIRQLRNGLISIRS